MRATHGVTINGRIHGELKNPDFPPEEEIRRLVRLVDGKRRYSLILWALPNGIPFDRVNHRQWPSEYMQTAGSHDRLTVEVRQIVDGAPKQFVIGRAADDEGTVEVVEWDAVKTEVRSNEVFSSDEAGDLFAAYYETGGIPDTFHLRQLDP